MHNGKVKVRQVSFVQRCPSFRALYSKLPRVPTFGSLCSYFHSQFIGQGSKVSCVSFEVLIKFLYLVYRDVLDRKLQAEFTGEVLARAVHPIVMISYLTNKPHGRDYQRVERSR